MQKGGLPPSNKNLQSIQKSQNFGISQSLSVFPTSTQKIYLDSYLSNHYHNKNHYEYSLAHDPRCLGLMSKEIKLHHALSLQYQGVKASKLDASATKLISRLKFVYTNPTGLNNKRIALDQLVEAEEPDIMCFAETWFNETSAPHCEHFSLYRADRRDRGGGGVCIYAHNKTKSSPVSNVDLECSTIEQVWCVCDFGTGKLLVGCVYRPKTTFNVLEDNLRMDTLVKSIKAAKNMVTKKEVDGLLLIGDFNFPNLSWSNLHIATHEGHSGHLDRLADKFTDTLDDHFLLQLINEPTFQVDNGKPTSVLDLLITDISTRVDNIKIDKPLGDLRKAHYVLSWDVNLPRSDSNRFESFSKKLIYSKEDYEGMNQALATTDWNIILSPSDMSTCYSKFLQKYDELCQTFIPNRFPSKAKFKAIWITTSLRRSISAAHRLWYWNQAHRWRDKAKKCEYETLTKRNKIWAGRLVREFEVRLAERSKTDPKLVYKYVRSKQKSGGSIRSLKAPDGSTAFKAADIAGLLRQQFDSVFIKDYEPSPSLPRLTTSICTEENVLSLINLPDIRRKLEALKIGKSIGCDGIHPHVLKHCAIGFAYPITLLFQKSLTSASVPTMWKLANVTAIFKKGSRLVPANYRPVSLTSILCKELEKLVKIAIIDHLNSNNLLSHAQHGFVKKKSCVTNLLEELDVITLALARGQGIILVLLDFAKAFDKVSHIKLVAKLEAYGISGKLKEWIKDFLLDRKQRVLLGEVVSDWSNVTSGVPQGSVLGPLLFIIFINDMPDGLRSKILLYADDSKLISTINGQADIELTQTELNLLVAWANKWLMELNLDKCKIMRMGPHTTDAPFFLSDASGHSHPLMDTKLEKDLGVHISVDLKPSAHCRAVAITGNRVLGVLRSTFVTRDVWVWKKLYMSLVRPHLEYASTVWNPSNVADAMILEKVQRRATKCIRSLRNLGYNERLAKLGLTTLEIRRQRGDLIQIFKTINNLECIQLSTPLKPKFTITRGHSLRLPYEVISSSNRNYYTAACSRRDDYLFNRARGLWNQLPSYVVKETRLDNFKKRLDEYLATLPGGYLTNNLQGYLS